MVRIRMTRVGQKHIPFYRIGVFDARTRRDGAYIENLGTYDPRQKDPKKKVALNRERFDYWVSKGAQPTEALARILKHVEKAQ